MSKTIAIFCPFFRLWRMRRGRYLLACRAASAISLVQLAGVDVDGNFPLTKGKVSRLNGQDADGQRQHQAKQQHGVDNSLNMDPIKRGR